MGEPQIFPELKKLVNYDAEMSIETHYSLFCETVPDELTIYAEAELNETPENVTKGMRILKQFLESKNQVEIDDNSLRAILRSCRYDAKKSLWRLERFLETRRMVVERIARMDIGTVQRLLEDLNGGFLPHRDKHGRAIAFSRFIVNLDLYDVEDCFTVYYAQLFFLVTHPMTSLCGFVFILDCKTPSLSLMYSSMRPIKAYVSKHYVSFPIRLKRIHILHENCFARWFFKIIRPLVPGKLVQRIFFHGNNLKSLQKYYHPDILPEEFGGKMGPIDTEFYRKDFLDFVKKLKSEHEGKNTS